MVPLVSLWLPILLSAVGVFVASSIVWMALPYHKTDWGKLKNDDDFLDAVRAQGVTPGQYMYPGCKPGDMKNPEMLARMKKGPWGTIVVMAGPWNMGRSLSLWFVHLLIVALFVGYVAGLGLAPGASFQTVFRFTTTMAWICYAGGAFPSVIWEGRPGSVALKAVVDGLIYALATGAIFAKFWPATV